MNNENKTIHDFDFHLICEYFSKLERQGPGSIEVTVKALSFIDHLTSESRIADIGCGTGKQTLVLAKHAPGMITGIDLFSGFIEILNKNAALQNLHERVTGQVGSMENLPFRKEELDVIWSEGAIYNIGFERGLREWRGFLKRGGFIAVSEACWLTDERPAEIDSFWNESYPGIDTIPNKIRQMQNAGYLSVASFVLPESCWTDEFHLPQKKVQEDFLKKNSGNTAAREFVEEQRREARLYAKYKAFYGYVFFIGKKSNK